ncbi:MAG: hypothetical protein VR64_20920 [Desulfatitalea sp. BRH_c12]|nr:MAG: hypothetical protein VR64_20920 [Desulfatitalea sp. BRH_c12]
MKKLLQYLVPILLCFTVQAALADLEISKAPKTVTLQEKLGGHLDGRTWSSEEFKGKVSVVFYVDPDKKDLNDQASEALRKANYPLEKYQSFAIINMAATWLPNAAISSSLEKKQKQYPNTIYVRDYKKLLVKEWGLSDDNSNVLAFDASGNLIFRKDGQLDENEIQTLVKTVHDHLE